MSSVNWALSRNLKSFLQRNGRNNYFFYDNKLRHLRMVPLCMCLLGHRRKMEGNQVLIKQLYITTELNVN